MPSKDKTFVCINNRISRGQAVVLTDREFLKEIRERPDHKCADIDVITTAFQATISGTAAMLCVPVAGRGVFTRARKIWLNGVASFPGPAPNERLGLVDTQIFADLSAGGKQTNYNGAKLLLDIISKKRIEVECLSVEGDTYRNTFTLDELEFARLYVYNYFLEHPGADNNSFNASQHLKVIRAGNKILLNKAPGIVIGCGTRSTNKRKALSIAADMFEMDPEVMTEFGVGKGLSIANSLALAIPVVNEGVLNGLAAHLSGKSFERTKDDIPGSEKDMAAYLKDLILDNKFILIESDMKLKD